MISKSLRIERTASAGIMITDEELRTVIPGAQQANTVDYSDKLNDWLQRTADEAQGLGSSVCSLADCKLVCAGTNLTKSQTPQTHVDADLTARCTAANCPDEGITMAQIYFIDAVNPDAID